MTFYEIEFPLAALDSDEVEEALLESGANSITFVDRGDEPVLEPKPGEFRLWSDTLVRALFQESVSAFDAAPISIGSPPRWGRMSRKPHACARSRTRCGNARGSTIGNRCASDGGFGFVPHDAETPRDPQTPSSCAWIPDSHSAPARIPPRRCVCRCWTIASRGPHGDRLWLRLRDSGDGRIEARRSARRRGGCGPAGADGDARQRHP